MITETDSLNCIEFDKYYVILPSMPLWDEAKFIKESYHELGKKCAFGFSYNSGTNTDFLSVEELKKISIIFTFKIIFNFTLPLNYILKKNH